MNLGDVKWIGHASFLINADGKNVYIDPFRLSDMKERADIILITHPHFDHFSMPDIKKIAGPQTQIFVPNDTVDSIKMGKVVGVEPGKNYYASEGLNLETVPAYNVTRERLDKHPKQKRWVGYIIQTPGMKIYHAGDTDFIDEMLGIHVDLALLPMSGTYTMDPDDAIRAANAIDAKQVAPMHYKAVLGKDGSAAAENKFKKEVKNSVILKEIQEAYYSF
jgi:L-ascorbate metabolism protein UlaG (beta-lactamase superfamily)